jgi:hypothetical protein
MRKLFEVAVEVDAAGHADPHFSRATVYMAIWAADAVEAERLALADLVGSGHVALTVPGRVTELDPFGWDAYVQARWAGLCARLPSEAEVVAAGARADAPPIQISFYPHE